MYLDIKYNNKIIAISIIVYNNKDNNGNNNIMYEYDR